MCEGVAQTCADARRVWPTVSTASGKREMAAQMSRSAKPACGDVRSGRCSDFSPRRPPTGSLDSESVFV